MDVEPIAKTAADLRCRPQLGATVDGPPGFTWDAARARFPALAEGPFNIAVEAVDRQVAAGRGDRVALRVVTRAESVVEWTYAELAERAQRFARVLQLLGVARGETVALWAGRVPAFPTAVLGSLRAGAICCPLADGTDAEALAERLEQARARVLVTTRRRYLQTVHALRPRLSQLAWVLLVDGTLADAAPGVRALGPAMEVVDPTAPEVVTAGDDPALLHFDAGPGAAVLHVHEALVAHVATARFALDLHADDVLWCTLDPATAPGLAYALLAPLALGVTAVIDEAETAVPDRIYARLQNQRVTVWCTSPDVIARLMADDPRTVRKYRLQRLRFLASVGSALPAEAVVWSREALGQPLHDQWCQAETGAVLLGNVAARPIQPGCLGRPLPGVEAAVVRRVQGRVVPIAGPAAEGELAIRQGWPSMARDRRGDGLRYRERMVDGWYLTGDRVRRDAAGDFWFLGRVQPTVRAASKTEPATVLAAC